MLTIGLAPSFQKHQSARKSGRFSQSANQCSVIRPPQCGHACSRRCLQNEIDWVDYSVLLTDAATAAQCRSPPPPPHAPPSTAACCCHERLSSFSAHFVKQNEKWTSGNNLDRKRPQKHGETRKVWLNSCRKKVPRLHSCSAQNSGNRTAECHRNKTESWNFRHH